MRARVSAAGAGLEGRPSNAARAGARRGAFPRDSTRSRAAIGSKRTTVPVWPGRIRSPGRNYKTHVPSPTCPTQGCLVTYCCVSVMCRVDGDVDEDTNPAREMKRVGRRVPSPGDAA